MKIPVKEGEADVDPLWIKAWCDVYWKDDVEIALHKARLWCLDNPSKRKTRRGLRAFLGNWIRRDCRLKPQMRMVSVPDEPKVEVKPEVRYDAIRKMKEALNK